MKPITKKDLWTAIRLAENSSATKAADFLRSLLPSFGKTSSPGLHKLAVIVGHNKKSAGAYAPYPIGESEFVFNSKVADLMLEMAQLDAEIELKIFHRKPMSSYTLEIDEVYSRVNAWGPDMALELHFNWLAKEGRVEMIHFPESAASENFAKLGLERFGRLMNVSKGKQKLIQRGKKSRGGRSLWACKCPIIMTEPFDCSNTAHLLRVEEIGHEGFAVEYLSLAADFGAYLEKVG